MIDEGYVAGLVAENARLASAAGDLWNELENLREYWQDTIRASFIEEYISRYEQLVSGPSGVLQ